MHRWNQRSDAEARRIRGRRDPELTLWAILCLILAAFCTLLFGGEAWGWIAVGMLVAALDVEQRRNRLKGWRTAPTFAQQVALIARQRARELLARLTLAAGLALALGGVASAVSIEGQLPMAQSVALVAVGTAIVAVGYARLVAQAKEATA